MKKQLAELVREAKEKHIYSDEIAQYLIDRGVVIQKHGVWIEDGYEEIPCVCSNCGVEAPYTSQFHETFDYDWEENLQTTGYEETREYDRTDYCPNCGAKMDGERKVDNGIQNS